MRIDSNSEKGRSILESLKTKMSGKVINEDQVTDMSYVPEPQGQNVPQAKQSLDKDEKDALMKQYPEYWNFEKMWHPEYKKLWQNASSYSEKQQVEIINDIIGQAATALGLNWDWIKDDTYLFGFYLINGSEKNMIIKVPYDFSFPSLRTKLLNWFKKTKEVNPGKKKAIKVSESFGQAVKGNTGSIENAAREFDAEVSPIEFDRIIREGLVDLHYQELSKEEFYKDNSFVPWSWIGFIRNSIDTNIGFVISLGDGPVPLQVTITGKKENRRCEAFLMFRYLKEDYKLLRLGSIFHLGKSDRRMTTSYAYHIVDLLANIRKHWNKVSTEIIGDFVPYNNEEALTKSIIALCVGDVLYLNEGFGKRVKDSGISDEEIINEMTRRPIEAGDLMNNVIEYAISIGLHETDDTRFAGIGTSFNFDKYLDSTSEDIGSWYTYYSKNLLNHNTYSLLIRVHKLLILNINTSFSDPVNPREGKNYMTARVFMPRNWTMYDLKSLRRKWLDQGVEVRVDDYTGPYPEEENNETFLECDTVLLEQVKDLVTRMVKVGKTLEIDENQPIRKLIHSMHAALRENEALNEGFGQSVKTKEQSVSDTVGELSEKTINEFIDKIKDYAIEIGWTPFNFYDLKHSYFNEEGQWGFPDYLRDMQFCLYSRESDDFDNKGLIVLLSFDLDCINTWHSILIRLKYVDPDTQDTYDGDLISRGHTFTMAGLMVISNILERATHLRESGTFRCFNHLDPEEALKVDKSIAKQLCINIADHWLITEGFGAGVKSTSVDKPHEIAKAFDRKMDPREFSLDLKEIAMDNGYTPVSVEWDDYGHPRDMMPETFVETKKNSISWASYFGLYSNESFYLCLKVTYGGVDDDSMFVGYDLLVSTNADKTTTSNTTFYTSTLFDNRSFSMSTSSLDMLSRVLQKAKSSIDKIEEICKDRMIGQFASWVNPDTPLGKVGKLIEEAHLNEGFGVGVKNAPLTKGDVIREISYLDWFTFTEKLMNKIAYSNLPFAVTQSPIFEIGRVYVPLDEEAEPKGMKFMIFSKEDELESRGEDLEDGQKDVKISLLLQKGPESSMFVLSVEIEDEDDTCKSKTLQFGQKNYMTHVSIERLMSFFEILSKINPGMDIASKFAMITDATDETAKNARDILQGYIDGLSLNEGFGQKIKKERGDMTDEEWRDHLNKMRAKDFDYTSREFIHRYCKKTHVLKSKGGFMIGEVPCYDYDKYLHILSDFLRKNDVEVDGELHMQLYPEDETICIEDNSSLYARIRDLGEMYTEMFKYNAIDTIGLFMRMASLIYNRRLDNGDLKSEFLTSLQKHQELNEGFAASVKRDAASPDVNGTLGDFSGKKMAWDEWRSNLIEALEKNGIERDDTGKTVGTFMVSGTAGISYTLDLPLDDHGLMQRFSLCIAGDYEHEYEGFYLMFGILNIGGGYVFPRTMDITPASFKRWYNSYFASLRDAGHKTYEVTPAAYNCILELILDLHKNLDIVKRVVEANKDQMNKQGSMGIKKIVSNIMLSIQ